ncbi:MAG TPA: DUF547 domain-containing protein [Thermoanaerobaculia bacterium]|nr:DUF547 domain-containing protein [Thermoanaerobaculia bacterium]
MRKALAVLLLLLPFSALAQEPDYSQWNRLLATYYDPARGMKYGALKAKDAAALQALRQQLGRVNVAALNPKQQLAYWINVYNVNVVATVVEAYPVDSIRDISTDPIIRLNVFKKERVPFGGTLLSLDDVEHKKIREAFKDARIHFAINCAAKSCPPIRPEAFTGARVDAQLDDQARKFLATGVRFERDGDELTIHTTKIMDWFGDDFDNWAGGRAAFIRRYVTPDKQRLIAQAKEIDIEYDDYDWALNDWKR